MFLLTPGVAALGFLFGCGGPSAEDAYNAPIAPEDVSAPPEDDPPDRAKMPKKGRSPARRLNPYSR
jgi:hypothetical protein